MAEKVTLKKSDGTVIYPQTQVDTTEIYDGAVTSAKIDWSTMPGSYTTSEQATPYTWINGKTIYQKTVDIGALPNNTNKAVAHGITGISAVIKIEGWCFSTANNNWWQLPTMYRGSESSYNTNVWVDSTNILIGNQADRSAFTGYVTIWYTK